jgi:hypothetical protein
MNRLIVPFPAPGRARAVGASEADMAVSRLVKYIPAEIISGYMAFSGLIDGVSQSSNLRAPAAWTLFAIGLILTPLYLWKIGRPAGVQWWQLPISMASFALWAYALGGPFRTVELIPGYPYESWFAALLAGLFSWAVAVIWKPVESPERPTSQTAPE